jgi:transcriptional regulator with XRE-family HTH domain
MSTLEHLCAEIEQFELKFCAGGGKSCSSKGPRWGSVCCSIRAARALLGWSQGYLAEGIGVSRPTVAGFGGGKREPHPATLHVLMSELAAAGIDFTERGMTFRKWPARRYVPTGIKSKIKNDPVDLGRALEAAAGVRIHSVRGREGCSG